MLNSYETYWKWYIRLIFFSGFLIIILGNAFIGIILLLLSAIYENGRDIEYLKKELKKNEGKI